jgi:hypothetical protein
MTWINWNLSRLSDAVIVGLVASAARGFSVSLVFKRAKMSSGCIVYPERATGRQIVPVAIGCALTSLL